MDNEVKVDINTLVYNKKLKELNELASNLGLKVVPQEIVETSSKGSYLDENYEIINIETGENEKYWTLDEELDNGMVFSYHEALHHLSMPF